MRAALPLFTVFVVGCGSQSIEREYWGGGEMHLSFDREEGEVGVDGLVTVDGATADQLSEERGAAFLFEERIDGEPVLWSVYAETSDFGMLSTDLPCVTGARMFVAATRWLNGAGDDGIEVGFYGTGIRGWGSADLADVPERGGSTTADLTWAADDDCTEASGDLGVGSVTLSWALEDGVVAIVEQE